MSMHVNLTTPYRSFSRSAIAIDRIGVHFSDTQISDYVLYLSLLPQFYTPPGEFITDTSAWTKIEGTFTATGNEQWMTIGRFFDSSETDTIILLDNSGVYICYMFIDDVCVRDMTLNSSDTTICTFDFPTTLTGIAADGKYLWSTGEITASISVTEPGIYWRRAIGECLYYTDTIRVLQQPRLSLGSDTTLCSNIPTQLNEPLNGLSYLWNTGSTGCCITPAAPGTYTVEAYNACGSVKDTIEVSFINCDNCIKFPSVFSPNNDGKNDKFGPILRCSRDFSFYSFNIYDRWGVRVFTSDAPGAAWDGKYKGTGQNMDTYYYYFKCRYASDNKTREFRGAITLVR